MASAPQISSRTSLSVLLLPDLLLCSLLSALCAPYPNLLLSFLLLALCFLPSLLLFLFPALSSTVVPSPSSIYYMPHTEVVCAAPDMHITGWPHLQKYGYQQGDNGRMWKKKRRIQQVYDCVERVKMSGKK